MKTWYSIKALGSKLAEIFIYDYIGSWGVTARDFVTALAPYKGYDLDVRIISRGGEITEGFGIYNALKRHDGIVNTYNDGLAASMASIVFLAGKNRYMAENALLMVHKPLTLQDGNADDLRKTADILDKYEANLLAVYASVTGIGSEELTAMLREETFLNADEAMSKGFATGLVAEVDLPIAAAMDASVFAAIQHNLSSNNRAAIAAYINTGGVPTMPPIKDKPEGVQPAPELTNVNVAVAAERRRVSDIRAAFAPFGDTYAALANQHIDSGSSVDVANAALIVELGKSTQPAGSVHVVEDERDKFRAEMVGALELRAGVGKDDPANRFRSYTLLEMARACVSRNSATIIGRDKMAVVAAAFTTSDFPAFLTSTAKKSMLKGWDAAPETYSRWTVKGDLSDFRPMDRVAGSQFDDLDEITEGGEYKAGGIQEFKETVKLLTFGKKFPITRVAIINDDLQVFTKMPQKMGGAARRRVGDLAYAVLTSNPLMSDGVALFHANHGNVAGVAGAPSLATLNDLNTKTRLQKDPNGILTQVMTKYLLVPAALEPTATEWVINTTQPGQNNANLKNPFANTKEVISDARLDINSAVKWYAAGDPSVYDTIEISYLDGIEEPYLEGQNGWNIDGVELKVRIDAAAKALSWQALFYNPGV
jgi:ATP-dependent protease ClpP protease subunit